MSPSFALQRTVSMLRKEHFADNASIGAAVARCALGTRIAPASITCETRSEQVGSGVRLSFTSRIASLPEDTAITHRFHFIDRDETRERAHLLTPDDPVATTEMLVLFEEGVTKDYFNVTVQDGTGLVLASDSIVFDDTGRLVPYPFREKYVSPLPLADASLEEVRVDGRRTLRFAVSVEGIEGPEPVHLLWESMGLVHEEITTCTPQQPVAELAMPLEDNPALVGADWVAIAVDEKRRLLAQSLFALHPLPGDA